MSWDGEERRRPVMSVEKELQQLKIEVAMFNSTVAEWMRSTVEYRHDLKEINEELKSNDAVILEKLSNLPCDKRAYVSGQLRIVWGVLIIVIGAIVTGFIGHIIKS